MIKKFKSHICRILQLLKLSTNRVLHVIETRGKNEVPSFEYPPIFIIGPPRSGSTLLFQVMVNAFNVNYTTNADASWYGGISFRKRFFPLSDADRKTDFNSTHGQTNGRNSPHECGEYWYQFFRRSPQYVPLEEADEKKMNRLRRSLQRMTTAGKAPLLFKNMNCALRMEPLGKTCPEALYIVTHRDTLWNAHSLLQVRKKVNGEYVEWWSMEPKEIEELKILRPEEQVVEQINTIHREIDIQREQLGKDRFFDVSYEELCNDPQKVMNSMNSFFVSHGINIAASDIEIPKNFPLSEQCRIDKSMHDRLSSYVRK